MHTSTATITCRPKTPNIHKENCELSPKINPCSDYYSCWVLTYPPKYYTRKSRSAFCCWCTLYLQSKCTHNNLHFFDNWKCHCHCELKGYTGNSASLILSGNFHTVYKKGSSASSQVHCDQVVWYTQAIYKACMTCLHACVVDFICHYQTYYQSPVWWYILWYGTVAVSKQQKQI